MTSTERIASDFVDEMKFIAHHFQVSFQLSSMILWVDLKNEKIEGLYFGVS